MKKIKTLLALSATVLALGLASCGKTPATSNSGSIGGNSTPSESVKPSDSTDPVVYETEVYLRTSFNNWGTNERDLNGFLLTEVPNESNTYQIEMPLYKGEQLRFSNKTLTWQTTSFPKDTTDFKVGASGNPEVVND